MIAGYEKELDLLRDRMVRAERTCNEEAALIERLRSDLSLSRSHAKNLEKTLNEVTSSTFWKLTWPMRYVVSKSRQIWHTFPLFVLLGELRRDGISGVREHARARREYAALFPGNLLRADRFAPVELLVRQANDQPAGPKISIVVPLYNTPLDFLDEMLDSVVNQTYQNWELCCVDAGKDEAVGQHVQARAKADARIRYQKLEKNELIPGNTNKGFEMATGEYIALLDHDDLLHPCALWYAARAIAEQKADFVYTDEATFEGKVENVVLYHFKPDFMLDNLRSNNYICHLTLFSRRLMERATGGPERMEYNGSQDYELFLRLTEQAAKIVHIPPRPLLLALQPRQHGQRHLRQDLLHRRGHCRPQGSLRPLRRGGGRRHPHPGHARLLQDGLHHGPSGPGEHPDPHLRPHPGSGALRGVHLRPHHLPGF